MKNGLLIATILTGLLANAGLALDPKVFPGKGSREAWTKACRLLDQGVEIAKTDEAAALPKFEQAIAIYPFADCFYRNLGVSYEKKKYPDLAKAENAYRRATELDPKDWRNWNALANAVGDQQRFRECRDALKKAATCHPPANALAEINKQIKNLDSYLVMQK
ncbi:MAG: hypothetical protein K2X81_24870 [Candidatus Obscuribacterales bacterium]|nr:hypothetical protein [Candidatus Obscuribacterales bacterium]